MNCLFCLECSCDQYVAEDLPYEAKYVKWFLWIQCGAVLGCNIWKIHQAVNISDQTKCNIWRCFVVFYRQICVQIWKYTLFSCKWRVLKLFIVMFCFVPFVLSRSINVKGPINPLLHIPYDFGEITKKALLS